MYHPGRFRLVHLAVHDRAMGSAVLVDVATGAKLARSPDGLRVRLVAAASAPVRLAVATADTVVIIDALGTIREAELEARQLAWSPDEGHLIVDTIRDEIAVVDAADASVVATFALPDRNAKNGSASFSCVLSLVAAGDACN